MSFGPSGQSSSYAPPPPPPSKGRSPWFYVAVGCGGLVLVSFVGCLGSVAYVGSKVKTAMNQPFDKVQALRDLGDVPPYPKATLDEQSSKAGRAGMALVGRFIKSTKTTVVAFHTEDLSGEVLAFYDKDLASKGYTVGQSRNSGAGGRQIQHMYVNKATKTMVMVQVQDAAADNGSRTVIVMRFDGVDTDKVKPEDLQTGG